MRAKRGRENETIGEAANDVDHERGAGNIAAHHTKRLGERALDQGHTVRYVIPLRNAATTRTVEADRVNLVEIGHGSVLFRNVADRCNGRYVAVHAVDAFESHDLRTFGFDR